MEIVPLILKEYLQEATTTEKFLKLVPLDKADWQPHPKSMNLKTLAVHIAELPGWVEMAVDADGIDFAKTPYEQKPIASREELMGHFNDSLSKGKAALERVKEEDLSLEWTLRNGDQILSKMTKYEIIRHSISQTIHHRAQLGVYLRLLDIPIPGSYGPSADENGF